MVSYKVCRSNGPIYVVAHDINFLAMMLPTLLPRAYYVELLDYESGGCFIYIVLANITLGCPFVCSIESHGYF